jgi:hypothetical protein
MVTIALATVRASASGPTAEADDRFLSAMGRQHDDYQMRAIGEEQDAVSGMARVLLLGQRGYRPLRSVAGW